jgi:preprotein translocase subunit SecA
MRTVRWIIGRRRLAEDPVEPARRISSRSRFRLPAAPGGWSPSPSAGSASLDYPRPAGIDDWDEFSRKLLELVEAAFVRRTERYIGPANDGSIAREIRTALDAVKGEAPTGLLLQILLRMPQGQRASFDKRTKQRVWQRTTRLTYVHYAAAAIAEEDADEQELAEKVNHLQEAQNRLQFALGLAEFARFNQQSVDQFPRALQRVAEKVFGEEGFARLAGRPLRSMDPSESGKLTEALGRFVLTSSYRQLMLRVISELWVEYLTQMEALRVSVGLEAYAQRDPLVMYKSRASELFGELLGNTRRGVVTRMFTYRVQQAIETSQAQEKAPDSEAPTNGSAEAEGELLLGDESSDAGDDGDGADDGGPGLEVSAAGKRRRRRKKR